MSVANGGGVSPVRSPLLVVLSSWLIPGGGYFLLGRRGRGLIVLLTVLTAFGLGRLMNGSLFVPGGNGFETNGRGALTATVQLPAQADVLSRLISYGGFVGDLASGLPYLISTALGYGPPDQASPSTDYGSKFLVAAGLLNILAIVDAYEIATRQKE